MEQGQYGNGDEFIGVRMGQVFDLAKKYKDMDLIEIEKLLEHKIHEVRTGGVSIMDFQARDKKTKEPGASSYLTCISAAVTALTAGILWTAPHLSSWWLFI